MSLLDESLSNLIRQVVREELSSFFPQQRTSGRSERLSYSIREAAEVTGASEYQIRMAIVAGELHGTQAGRGKTGRYIVPVDCLHAWLHGLPQPTGRKR